MALALVLNRRRQVPAEDSPAFGAIAERFRRAGELERAVALCQEGLQKYPKHLSSRVTLGWALLDLGRYDEARVELEQVLKRAPDNLAAIRGLAQLHDRTEHDDVASMQSGPSQWSTPDAAAEFSSDAPAVDEPLVVDAPGDPPHAVLLDASGPWVGLQAEAASGIELLSNTEASMPSFYAPATEAPAPPPSFAPPAGEGPNPAAFFDPTSEADALAAELLAGGPRPVERIADDRRWSAVAPPTESESPDQYLAARGTLPEVDAAGPWFDDGAETGAPEPVQLSQPASGRVPAGQPAVPYDEIVLDDGPGPWPPVLQDDEPPAGREPLRLALSSAQRDVWPPFDARPAAKPVPVQPPVQQPVASTGPSSEFSTTIESPPKAGLLSALSRFRRRVDSRKRTTVSEYVAG